MLFRSGEGREGGRDLEHERDALAAHVERQSELLSRLVSAMRNYEMDADPDYPPPRDHRAMMSDAEAALKAVPETSLARRDAQIKANELERFMGIYLTPGLAHNRATGELQSLKKQAEGH